MFASGETKYNTLLAEEIDPGFSLMHLLDIYQTLPQTNCRKCGEASCMAFALKVQTGQRLKSECVHLKDDDSAGQESAGKVDDSYEHVCREQEQKIRTADFDAAARAIGGECLVRDGEDLIALTMLSRTFEVRRGGLFEDDAYCHDSWLKLIAYDYVLRGAERALTGTWVSFDHFPHTPSHIKAFQKRAEDSLGRLYGASVDGCRATLEAFGAHVVEGEAKADLCSELDLLPNVPLRLAFWAADDEFPASCKLFIDSNAIAHLDVEYVSRLIAAFVALAEARAYKINL